MPRNASAKNAEPAGGMADASTEQAAAPDPAKSKRLQKLMRNRLQELMTTNAQMNALESELVRFLIAKEEIDYFWQQHRRADRLVISYITRRRRLFCSLTHQEDTALEALSSLLPKEVRREIEEAEHRGEWVQARCIGDKYVNGTTCVLCRQTDADPHEDPAKKKRERIRREKRKVSETEPKEPLKKKPKKPTSLKVEKVS